MQCRQSANINVPSDLLDSGQNHVLFNLIGPGCKTLASAVVQVFLANPPESRTWCKLCCGVATFVKDSRKKSYYFRVYDIFNESLLWEQELYKEFQYNSPTPYFHTFDTHDCTAALNFACEQEARNFETTVHRKLQQFRRGRRKTEDYQMNSVEAYLLKKLGKSEGDMRKDAALQRFLDNFIKEQGGYAALKRELNIEEIHLRTRQNRTHENHHVSWPDTNALRCESSSHDEPPPVLPPRMKSTGNAPAAAHRPSPRIHSCPLSIQEIRGQAVLAVGVQSDNTDNPTDSGGAKAIIRHLNQRAASNAQKAPFVLRPKKKPALAPKPQSSRFSAENQQVHNTTTFRYEYSEEESHVYDELNELEIIPDKASQSSFPSSSASSYFDDEPPPLEFAPAVPDFCFFNDLTNRDSGCGYSAASSDVSSLGGHPITSLMDEIRNFRKTNLNSVAPKKENTPRAGQLHEALMQKLQKKFAALNLREDEDDLDSLDDDAWEEHSC